MQVMLLAVGPPAAAARRLAAAAAGGGSPDGKTPIAYYGSGLLIEYYVSMRGGR